jgi:hypothetical protein
LEGLQAQYHAAATAGVDFQLIAALGMQLDTAQQESAQLPLSEEDYLTLSTRHATLVQRVEQKCRELMQTKAFPALAVLSAKFAALKNLDLGIAPEWANDPVFVAVEEVSGPDWANDPVLVSDDGSNDPVIVSRKF